MLMHLLSGDAQSEEARADPMVSDANPVASPDVPLGGMTDQEWTNQDWTDKEWQDWTNREWTDKNWQDWTKSFNPVEAEPPPRVPAEHVPEVGSNDQVLFSMI